MDKDCLTLFGFCRRANWMDGWMEREIYSFLIGWVGE